MGDVVKDGGGIEEVRDVVWDKVGWDGGSFWCWGQFFRSDTLVVFVVIVEVIVFLVAVVVMSSVLQRKFDDQIPLLRRFVLPFTVPSVLSTILVLVDITKPTSDLNHNQIVPQLQPRHRLHPLHIVQHLHRLPLLPWHGLTSVHSPTRPKIE